MKAKRIILLLLILLLGAGIWYFSKGYNYKITFKTPHAPGTVYSSLLNWKIAESDKIDSLATENKHTFNSVEQSLFIGDSIFSYDWKIERVNDSVSSVTAYIKDINNSFSQNLSAIYSKNDFVKKNINLVEAFMNSLYVHRKDYKVKIEDGDYHEFNRTFCTYLRVKSQVFLKGQTMVSNIGIIMDYLKGNEIPLTGDPYLEVVDWDMENEIITYDFCFPINYSDKLPPASDIKFKYSKEISGLKAIFNGNYRLSDRAWYELLDHAERNDIKLKGFPVEIYRNDPHVGYGELDWVAEVYWAVE